MGVRASESQAISVEKPAFWKRAPGVRSSLRHSGADSTFSPVLWSVSEFKQRLDSSIEASHRAWDGNLIRRPCDQLHLPHQ